MPFKTLLYRYFFFGWLFKDVKGLDDPFARAAVMRHNKQQAAWLPKYMVRWLGWCFFFYGVAGVFELVLDAPLLAHLFYAFSALCIAFGVMAATAWVALTRRQQQQ